MAFLRPLSISDLPIASRDEKSLTIVASHAITTRTKRPLQPGNIRSQITITFTKKSDSQRLLLCTFEPVSDHSDISTSPIIVKDTYRSAEWKTSTTHYSKQNDTLIIMNDDRYERLVDAGDSALTRHSASVGNLLDFLEERSAPPIFCCWPVTGRSELEQIAV